MKTVSHYTRQGENRYLEPTNTNTSRKYVLIDGKRWTNRGLVVGDPEIIKADHEKP